MKRCLNGRTEMSYFVIPAQAGIQKIKDWIPGQARNDNKEDKPF
jgi:hypothetical protein